MKYLCCFSGGLSTFYNYTRYNADSALMVQALLTVDGFSADRTTILVSDGTSVIQLPSGTLSTSVATKAGLLGALGTLADKLTSTDVLIFAATNHGGPGDAGSQKSVLWCWNDEQVSSDEFASALATMTAETQVYIFGQCYSGGFITSLGGTNRLIMTACRFDEVSYATEDSSHDEFLLAVGNAILGNAKTFKDVFQAALAADTQPEHPQLSDPAGIADRTDILTAAVSS
jgi:hypothetical protein